MNDEKFDTLGKKLNVLPEDLPHKTPNVWVKKVGFFLAQGLILAGSAIFGLLWGFTEQNYNGYPFFTTPGAIGGVGLIGIDIANWKLTTKRDAKVGVSLKRRVKILNKPTKLAQ